MSSRPSPERGTSSVWNRCRIRRQWRQTICAVELEREQSMLGSHGAWHVNSSISRVTTSLPLALLRALLALLWLASGGWYTDGRIVRKRFCFFCQLAEGSAAPLIHCGRTARCAASLHVYSREVKEVQRQRDTFTPPPELDSEEEARSFTPILPKPCPFLFCRAHVIELPFLVSQFVSHLQ